VTAYEKLQSELKRAPRVWLITGVAGFIGSNLLETLLKLDQRVVGLDNLATGHHKNLKEVEARVPAAKWKKFTFSEGDICDVGDCKRVMQGIDHVLHHAALGSVPHSIAEPIAAHAANVTGFINVLEAARAAKVKRFVYASSSAVYGDDPDLPKVEEKIGQPLSPYAATKLMDEIYANTFAKAYGIECVGLRYFNVFGPRQDPGGAYAAVIPKWIAALLRHEPVRINGDGETSRDFCYIENVVQANLLAAMSPNKQAVNTVYNIALGERTTLNQLFNLLRDSLVKKDAPVANAKPVYQDFRAGDVRHSLADILKAKRLLGYAPTHSIKEGLMLAMDWYRQNV
jgi:UDP-N-acetylglucosamine 4-epimerase